MQTVGARPINLAKIPSEIKLGPAMWNKKRTKYKVCNSSVYFFIHKFSYLISKSLFLI